MFARNSSTSINPRLARSALSVLKISWSICVLANQTCLVFSCIYAHKRSHKYAEGLYPITFAVGSTTLNTDAGENTFYSGKSVHWSNLSPALKPPIVLLGNS